MKGERDRVRVEPVLGRRYIRLRYLAVFPLLMLVFLWWDSSRFETVAYWDGASVSPAIGQGYGWLRIEWIHYTSPSIAGGFGSFREPLEDYSPGGFSFLGLMFPPAIDHTFSRVEDTYNLTFVAWWLVLGVCLFSCVFLFVLWSRYRIRKVRRLAQERRR